jgi:hypothetical protein
MGLQAAVHLGHMSWAPTRGGGGGGEGGGGGGGEEEEGVSWLMV